MNFQCEDCDKISKTSGGLKLHTRKKHGECQNNITITIETEKLKMLFIETCSQLFEEDLYNKDILDSLKVIIIKQKSIKNKEKFYIHFYEVVVQSPEDFFQTDYKVGTILSRKLGEKIFSYFLTLDKSGDGEDSIVTKNLNEKEYPVGKKTS